MNNERAQILLEIKQLKAKKLITEYEHAQLLNELEAMKKQLSNERETLDQYFTEWMETRKLNEDLLKDDLDKTLKYIELYQKEFSSLKKDFDQEDDIEQYTKLFKIKLEDLSKRRESVDSGCKELRNECTNLMNEMKHLNDTLHKIHKRTSQCFKQYDSDILTLAKSILK